MTTSPPIVAVYPGSFDPVTLGHEDVARRTLRVCDRLVVAVAESSSQSKRHLFEVPERLEIMREVFAGDPGIECVSFSGLLVDFAREMGARFIVRGLRAVSDFEYEFQMAQMNRELWDEAETVFLAPDVPYSFLSASLVREVASLGGDVTSFVSPPVHERLRRRFG
ncbi:MAG: pantetheine-phosphate adenylyltransferase [Gemmatimonadota bacterium]|nr:pantetheine-phosphate adenylyltransferase [Gemmatimonadota bacterium]MDE2863728.1 pantetheine-phosphate adenylyltransferase [Gemmatimonadota bacterium]MXV95830.1 pantetheine-phosphate adenylyltransferase [Gemmatimonadota bacterium]MYB05080.1 pantetheine-phosphate adenylyltransferase [Gemmatimonadota bacterium]MYE17556.1 pantetheine-phosphate adenylyltransferase [Gemmatimonadota bacterium]